MPRERVVRFFPKQGKAFQFTTQFGAVICGVQSGKTFLGVHWAGKKIIEFPKKVGVIIAPTYKILRHSTLAKFFEIFPELRRYYKEHKGEINLPTGGTVFIRSSDNPLGVEGMSPHWAWLDEAGMMPRLIWTVIRSRVSLTGGQVLITTTPYNMGWLYTDFYLSCKEGKDKALSVFGWKSIESPYFTKEFYEAERTRLRPEEFARRYEGEFRKMTGLVYDLPEEQIIDPIDIMKKAEAKLIGVDWGYTNPAALSVCYLHDKIWYITDEWKRAKRTTEEIRQVIKNKLEQHRVTRVYPDPAEPDRIEECRRDNIPVMEVNKDLKGGISYIQQLIREKRLFVFNNCSETISEMSMYHYPEEKERKVSKDEPEKINDHLMDAMRYAIYSYKPVQIQQAKASPPLKIYYPEIGY